MPIVVWRPTFFMKKPSWGPGALFFCMRDDLDGVDLDSLGLPPPIDHDDYFQDRWGVLSDQAYCPPRAPPPSRRPRLRVVC
jgi:hypothetical protein